MMGRGVGGLFKLLNLECMNKNGILPSKAVSQRIILKTHSAKLNRGAETLLAIKVGMAYALLIEWIR